MNTIQWFERDPVRRCNERAKRLLFAFLAALGLVPAAHAASVKVALIHYNPVLEQQAQNLAELEGLVAQALNAGAKIVVTPELATTGFSITRDQVIQTLGMSYPYPEFSNIRALAIEHQAYVFVAFAETEESGASVYNSMAIYGPSGLLNTQQKRGLSGWHERGILPFSVLQTPYGDIGYLICSDSYLPDWIRILSLEGADMIVSPANWWGTSRVRQEDIWATRAKENSVWFITANRWGSETDTRFGFPFTYDMNDAPSAVIAPDGSVKLLFRAYDQPLLRNRILYQTIEIPDYRIGTNLTPAYTIRAREPGAYSAIGNNYYRPDLGNALAPDLPNSGAERVATLVYRPSISALVNLHTIQTRWLRKADQANILVLPGLGITSAPVNSSESNWYSASYWQKLQEFIDRQGFRLVVTSVLERVGSHGIRESVLLLRAGQPPELRPQIHDSFEGTGSGTAPAPIDIGHLRVGVLLGRDALFPETSTHLAKLGTDLLLVTSRVGADPAVAGADSTGYLWNEDMLQKQWQTATNHVFHLAAADWTETGAIVENVGGIVGQYLVADSITPLQVLTLNSEPVRIKYLNAYYSFDLEQLLSR